MDDLVFLGTLLVSVPTYGVGLVTPEFGSTEIKDLYVARLPINDATSGAIRQAHYVDGTAVVCLRDVTNPKRAYILCPAAYAAANYNDILEAESLYDVGNYKQLDDDVFTDVLAYFMQSDSIGFKNQAHGADIDALPGDSDTVDLRGNAGTHIGRYIAQLRGSPFCYIDASNITNKIRTVSLAVETNLPCSYTLSSKELNVEDIAINDQEAFGVIAGTPLTVLGETDELAYTDENALPLYRFQHISGAAADGIEDIVVAAPDTTHYCTVEPPILSKKRSSLSGELFKASAVGIQSIKSPAIEAIHQVNYDTARSLQEQQDILKPWEYQEEEDIQNTASIDEQIDDAALNKIIDKLFTGDYLNKLKAKMAEHGLAVSHSEATIDSKIKEEQVTGPSTDQEYGLPPSIQLTDPISGKVTTYYASTSFITQEPDGSILICDGYGSEIRMSRGNIYISPALDLFFRPGRDLSTMVPRHQSYNAQGHTTINTGKSMYLRAVNDMKIVGATDGSGMVTLESRAVSNELLTNGLLIKCKVGTAIVGNDIYIGRNSGNGVTENRVEEPKETGTIIIDACSNGVINERCGAQTLDTGSLCMVASNNRSASAIRLETTAVGIYTNSVELPAFVNMIGKGAQEKVTVVRNGLTQELTLNTRTGAPQLVVEGACLVGGQFICNGRGHFCGQVVANGVFSIDPYCSVVDTRYNDPFKKTDIKKLEAGISGTAVANMVVTASRYLYQDLFITINGFSFPTTYNVPTHIRVPGMVWQSMDRNNARNWEEVAVTSILPTGETVYTMCYPGKDVWDTATVSGIDYQIYNLSDGYTTNIPEGAL